MQEFSALWDAAEAVNESWIKAYEDVYSHNRIQKSAYIPLYKIHPNTMQQAALAGIQALRDAGQDRGLLISATGTGKTIICQLLIYANVNPMRSSFVVHRE